MKIEKGTMVSVTYELKYDNADASLIEKVEKDHPLVFPFGIGRMLEHFEKNLEGLEVGDTFDFCLTADQAYGQITQDAIVDVPRAAFLVDGKFDEKLVALGNVIPMMDAYGNQLQGIVLEITQDAVKMDFNHPLAGEALHFKGRVEAVRKATEADLKPQGCGGCGGGSCGEGGCESGGCKGGCC